jgi:hypothetical protein
VVGQLCCLLTLISADLTVGFNFNHKARSWLVVWEAGVIVELPPWVLVLYPSSLFLHFNIDIHGKLKDCAFIYESSGLMLEIQTSSLLLLRMEVGQHLKTPSRLLWMGMSKVEEASFFSTKQPCFMGLKQVTPRSRRPEKLGKAAVWISEK